MNEQIFLKNERDNHFVYFDLETLQFILVEINSIEHNFSNIFMNSKIQVYNFGVSRSAFTSTLRSFEKNMVESSKEEFTEAYNQATEILNTLEI